VVESDPVDLLLYEKYLEGSGYQVLATRTVREARKLLRQVRPTAVLLDIRLDAESGWVLLTELKGQAATRDVPVFVVTVLDGREQALALGAEDFCLKPIDQEWLLGRLNAIGRNKPLRKRPTDSGCEDS
jgi:DNA-binding response OmpR family regulator